MEPNDVISQADGPVSGGTSISGSLSTADDIDYFVLYAEGQVQLRLTATDLTHPGADSCMDAALFDTNGAGLPEDAVTAAGVNRYFVRIESFAFSRCSGGMTYRFEIGPASGVTSGPPLDRTLSTTAEPNDTPQQAGGALRPLVNYVGAHERGEDQDWFYFWVPAGTHRFDLSLTAPAQGPCPSSAALYAGPTDASSLDAVDSWGGTFEHITRSLTGPATYYVWAGLASSDCIGERWQFRIETPTAVTSINPFAAPGSSPSSSQPSAGAARTPYASRVTLRRRGARYSGRVRAGWRGCVVRRRVTLRRSGSAKVFAATHTRADGTFTIRRRSRLRGRVYVRVPERATATTICRTGRSKTLRR